MRMKRQGPIGTRVWYLAINVIILHLLQGSVSEAGCPSNVGTQRPTKQRNGVCYVFYQAAKTWDQARNACHGKGGNLVIIPDRPTQDFLVASLRSLRWPRPGVWIGATDRDEEGQWIWQGTSVRLSYQNWAPNQIRQPPAGRSGSKETESNDREDCAQIRIVDTGRWHDFPCNVSSSYICQFGSVSRPRPRDK
ncbi:perlucin-like protein [Pomacea canaliculata]|uniref:perlucin-like protein n=1 Tax=Pomacea canaliculata TaxID=400727 RepID=UPI000D73A609|nr:perlucin-like protein [Pomacea canaliculata]